MSASDFGLTFSLWILPYAAGCALSLFLFLENSKVPLKRTYHQIFGVLMIVNSLWFLDRTMAATTNSPQAYLPYSRGAVFIFPAILTLVFQLTVSFVYPRQNRGQKYAVWAVYAVMLVFWGVLIADEKLLIPGAVVTAAGLYADAPGPLEPLLALYFGGLVIFVLLALSWRYLRQSANVMRTQTKYLLVGTALSFFGGLTEFVSRDLGTPPLDFVLVPVGLSVVLVGFRKHGFSPVSPVDEPPASTPPRFNLPAGFSYISFERDPKNSFQAFADLIQHGRQGLCISRSYPENVRELYALKATPVRWLTEAAREDAIAPGDLQGLSLTISSFVQAAPKPVVVLQGLEYLISVNGFAPILRLIQQVNDTIAEKNGILLLPLIPSSLSERQEALLAAECAQRVGPEVLLRVEKYRQRFIRADKQVTSENQILVSQERERRLAAIMLTDIVGFSKLAQLDEGLALGLLDEYEPIIRSIVLKHNGREVKTMGDAFLVEFRSALEAVQCALEIQNSIGMRNQKSPAERRAYMRIGIHVGDVVDREGDVLGDAVNIASRIEPFAEPGYICVSQQVYDQVWNKVDCTFQELGKKELKNIGAQIGVYQILRPEIRAADEYQ